MAEEENDGVAGAIAALSNLTLRTYPENSPARDLHLPGKTLKYLTITDGPDLIDLTEQIAYIRGRVEEQMGLGDNRPLWTLVNFNPVFITRDDFETAVYCYFTTAQKPGLMARLLMHGVFRSIALMECSLTGRRPPQPNVARKVALDQNAKDVIIRFVLDAYRYSVFGEGFPESGERVVKTAMRNELRVCRNLTPTADIDSETDDAADGDGPE